MKRGLLILLVVFMISSLLPLGNVRADNEPLPAIRDKPVSTSLTPQTFIPMGVVVFDDTHQNDYSGPDMELAMSELADKGYITKTVSEFASWSEAVSSSNYLVITAPFDNFTTSEIDDVVQWFADDAANLLLASRGDFSEPPYNTMNDLLSSLQTGIRVQDDNIYTTDPAAYREWYIDTDNFDTGDYAQLSTGVERLSFFSPSSVSYTGNATPIVYAEAFAYQSDEAGAAPAVIYDNTDDGTGGDAIPLAVAETVDTGVEADRVIAVGTTMWSDFDYGDTYADDPIWFENIINYFRDGIIETAGNVTLKVPDDQSPEVSIVFPRDGAILQDTIDIMVSAQDAFGVTGYEIKIDGQVVGNSPLFSWDTTQYAAGSHTVTVTAVDDAGNEGTATHHYTIDQDHVPSLPSQPKIMSYNIKQSGVFDAWFDVMVEENPDVVILIETGDFDDNNNAILNQVTDDLNAQFFDMIPYKSYTLQGIPNDFNGITILSRYDIKSSTKLSSLTLDNGNALSIPLPFLHSVIDINGVDVNIIGGHLTCCPGENNWIERKNQQEAILNYMDDLGNVPIIYMGDMNSVSPDDVDPASEVPEQDLGTEPIQMVLDPTHPKASNQHTFVDAALEMDTRADTFIGSVLSRIDFIFLNHHFDGMLVSSTTGDTPSASMGSDHVPVDAVLDLSTFPLDNPQPHFPPASGSTTPTPEETSNVSLPFGLLGFSVALAMTVIIRSKRTK